MITPISGLETVIEAVATPQPIAWWPAALQRIVTSPSGRTWEESVGTYLCLFTLPAGRGTSFASKCGVRPPTLA